MIKTNKRLDFIGIGTVRSATTWIFQCIKEHPEVCTSLKKETRFFERNFLYRKGITYYQSIFEQCQGNKIIGEFTPTYFRNPIVAYRILQNYPNIKIILSLRNPIERIRSEYILQVKTKLHSVIYKTFEDAIKRNHTLLKTGFYYKNIKKYYDLFPKSNILILIYEEIYKNPIKFIQNVYKFLDLKDRSFIPPSIKRKINYSGYTIYKPKIPLINKIFYYFSHRIPSESSIKKFLRKLGGNDLITWFTDYNLIRNVDNSVSDSIQSKPIQKSTRELLVRIFSKDIKKVEKLIDKDLSFWN